MLRKVIVAMLLFALLLSGCASGQDANQASTKFTEQDVRNAVTELIEGINNGDLEVVKKYVGVATPVAEKLVDKLKNNVRLSDVRDVSIDGTTAQATVTLEVIPLEMKKDLTLTFDLTDVLLLNNPLGLLAILLK